MKNGNMGVKAAKGGGKLPGVKGVSDGNMGASRTMPHSQPVGKGKIMNDNGGGRVFGKGGKQGKGA